MSISADSNIEPMKYCTKKTCENKGIPLPLSEFPKDSNKPDGLSLWCKQCRSKSARRWQERNREKHCAADKRYRELNPEKTRDRKKRWINKNIERHRTYGREFKRRHAEKIKALERAKKAADPYGYWVKKNISGCKARAKRKGVPFSMTREDLLPLPEFCCVFGIKLDYLSGTEKRSWASIDRIDPKLGYVSGNIRIISRAANMAKLDGIGDILTIYKITNPN